MQKNFLVITDLLLYIPSPFSIKYFQDFKDKSIQLLSTSYELTDHPNEPSWRMMFVESSSVLFRLFYISRRIVKWSYVVIFRSFDIDYCRGRRKNNEWKSSTSNNKAFYINFFCHRMFFNWIIIIVNYFHYVIKAIFLMTKLQNGEKNLFCLF